MLISTIKSYISYLALIISISVSAAINAAGATNAPSAIAVAGGDQQTGLVGTPLPTPFTVQVTDSNGGAVEGVKVKWMVDFGAGSLSAKSTTTDANGLTSSMLTLGTVSGHNQVTATIVATGGGAILGATADAGSAVAIGLSGGNEQTGTVGSTLPGSLAVICRDKYGNGASHTEVDWTVLSGGGSIPYTYSLSEAGVATKALTLGTVPGVNKVMATIHGTSSSYTFSDTGVTGPAAAIVIASGNDQTGMTSGALPGQLTVTATDVYGNPSSGVKIDWTADTSGDALSPGSSMTNASGLAGGTLTLGTAFGVHRATATIGGTAIAQTFTATEGVNAVASARYSANPRTLQPYFLGLSYQKTWESVFLFNAHNLPLVTLYSNLGPGVLRILAERSPDPIVWDKDGPGQVYGYVSQADIARLAAFVKAANWKVLYGIALVGNTPEKAASEAAVAVKEFGSSLLGLEIGNEPDNYINAVYGDPALPQIPNYTFQDYISTTPVYSHDGTLLPSWPAFASAIEAAAPGAPLTGPAGGFDWVMQMAASSQAPRLSLLTRHYYRLPKPKSPVPTMADLLAPDPTIAVKFSEMAATAAAAKIPGGFRISECNSIAGTVPGVTNGFGAALWTIDFLFDNAFYQSTGVEFHGGGDDPPGSFTPLLDNSINVTRIGPDYYGLFAYSLVSKGGELLSVQLTPSISTLSAYAVQQTNGTTDIILSNKDPENSVTIGVSRPGSTMQATSYLLTAPSLTATKGFELGGSPINIDGSWIPVSNPSWPMVDNTAVITVPAGSAQIVHMW